MPFLVSCFEVVATLSFRVQLHCLHAASSEGSWNGEPSKAWPWQPERCQGGVVATPSKDKYDRTESSRI